MKSLRMIISILGPVLGMLVITLAGVRPAYLQTGQTPPAQRPDPSIQGTAEAFKGITTDGKVREGLFKIKSTGVSTAAVRKAADDPPEAKY